jgi:hypothetical protein
MSVHADALTAIIASASEVADKRTAAIRYLEEHADVDLGDITVDVAKALIELTLPDALPKFKVALKQCDEHEDFMYYAFAHQPGMFSEITDKLLQYYYVVEVLIDESINRQRAIMNYIAARTIECPSFTVPENVGQLLNEYIPGYGAFCMLRDAFQARHYASNKQQ